MKFTELTTHTTSEGSELVADVMWRYTNYGVAISDVSDVIALQKDKVMYWDYMDEDLTRDREEVLVKAYVPLDEADKIIPMIRADIEEIVRNSEGLISFGSLEQTSREVEGDEWLEVWKSHFKPIHIGEKIVVVPEWVAHEKKPGEEIVKLDSNMAFGTGEHETTSMCLELLQDYLTADSVCVDVGCGSGILGISAIKLGAKHAYLTDIDYVAVESAKHNAKINGVEDCVTVAHSDLLQDTDISGDIVLANITADVLTRLAPSILKNLAPGGTLILSGIIDSAVDKVLKAYGDEGLTLERRVKKGEWTALAYKN
ncbi:MAG: 50S ribosomal protein L11 methyltransferase [Clostridia bacterium]|nr:50S ribosomal protein L11 methyltransferase [Clostridia bacterium]